MISDKVKYETKVVMEEMEVWDASEVEAYLEELLSKQEELELALEELHTIYQTLQQEYEVLHNLRESMIKLSVSPTVYAVVDDRLPL